MNSTPAAREARGSFTTVYSARVRITVRTPGGTVVRDGHGTGEAHGSSAGEVHDRALKAAETDATKRALATFGKAFGLALYAGGRGAMPKSPGHARFNGVKAGDPAEAVGALSATGAERPAAIALPRPPASPPPVAKSATALPDPAAINAPTLRRRIDKNALALPEPHRVRDKEHLRYVASQPCLMCRATPSDAHHVRFAQPRAMGRKVGDEFTVPLCRAHHRELHHSGNEAAWWHDMGIDPLDVAQQLWSETEGQRHGRSTIDRAQ